jgi:hypothetical protein
MKGDIKAFLDSRGCAWEEADDLNAVASDVDVLYMTRIQKERFTDMAEYQVSQWVCLLLMMWFVDVVGCGEGREEGVLVLFSSAAQSCITATTNAHPHLIINHQPN